jgi:hypothetical protein
VQDLLALGRASFTWILGTAALIEVVLLITIGADLTAVALALIAIQSVCAGMILLLSLRPPVRKGSQD